MSGFLLRELAKTRAELASTRRRLRIARHGREKWKREALEWRESARRKRAA